MFYVDSWFCTVLLLFVCFFSEQFFPDFQINGDTAYFVRACKQLTEEDKFIVGSSRNVCLFSII